MKLIILFALLTATLAEYDDNNKLVAWWDTDDNKENLFGTKNKTPFPKCLLSNSKSRYFDTSAFEKLFEKAFRDEDYYSNNEHYENSKKNYNDVMDYDADEYRKHNKKNHILPSVAMRLTKNMMTALACDIEGTDKKDLNKFLKQFRMPGELCSFMDKVNCDNKTEYRTPTGVCNNYKQPYLGSAHTAFGRILPADYDDNVSKPKQKSCRGGLLPSCRKISLALGSKPKFDRSYNNFFVIFGQYIGHDIALSLPATDNYLTPVSTCTCSAKYDWNKCTVIDIQPDDPYLGGQKCMAFPATAQAFQNEVCSLGVKEQINGNTHIPDLSNLYGSTLRTSLAMRADYGLMKCTRRSWSKYELPPAQREDKSCEDETAKRKCFAGGDSRLVVDLLFTGIQAIFLRNHNMDAKLFKEANPGATSNEIYEETREKNIYTFQGIVYYYWLPTLLGKEYGDIFVTKLFELSYNQTVEPVVFNEVATAAFRLHTLIRDLFTRCTPDGHRIDQLWLHDISNKVKYAYDAENNGLDSILCGSFYDYGFAHDGNFAHQVHNRLFESNTGYGGLWRNDLVAINICRGREHGIQGYNAYREHYGLVKAEYFEDFADTMNYDAIKLLKYLYKHPDDVDLFVGLTLEDAVTGGLVGKTSALILIEQFINLCAGDRFCSVFSYEGSAETSKDDAIAQLLILICRNVHIDEIPSYPFSPPDDVKNLLVSCKEILDAANIEPITVNGVLSVKTDGKSTSVPNTNPLNSKGTKNVVKFVKEIREN